MILTKQTFGDFQNYCDSIKEEYQSKENEYNWKCIDYSERLEDVHYFYITNKFQTTKIMYIPSAKIMDSTNIYTKDLDIIITLKETL